MTSCRSRFGSVARLLALVSILSGCANLGIRPNEPTFEKAASPCEEYGAYSNYAQTLQEAYHSRATQNRSWLYVAGILGLGVAAASGGLAVAGVAAGTLGLLALSGGFAAGSFAVVNNNALAFSYTVAANSVDEALKSARGQLVFVDRNDANKGYAPASCADALRTLITGVSNARTRLEVARTDNAAGALVRAKDQLNILNQQIATVEPVDITHMTFAADIVRVDPNKPKQAGQPTPVQITVKNVKLDQVGLGEVKIEFGQKQYLAAAITKSESDDATYIVTFIAPVTPPDTGVQKYVPALILQGKARVQGKDGPNTVFTYP